IPVIPIRFDVLQTSAVIVPVKGGREPPYVSLESIRRCGLHAVCCAERTRLGLALEVSEPELAPLLGARDLAVRVHPTNVHLTCGELGADVPQLANGIDR